jgi:hypothetical protein
MSEGVLCSLFGTIAQLLGTVLSIVGAVIVVSMQRAQMAVDKHAATFGKMPGITPAERTSWLWQVYGGEQNEWHDQFLKRAVKADLANDLIQSIQIAAISIADAGDKHRRTVELFKVSLWVGAPTLIFALLTLPFATALQQSRWAWVFALLMILGTAVSLAAAGWMLWVGTAGANKLKAPPKPGGKSTEEQPTPDGWQPAAPDDGSVVVRKCNVTMTSTADNPTPDMVMTLDILATAEVHDVEAVLEADYTVGTEEGTAAPNSVANFRWGFSPSGAYLKPGEGVTFQLFRRRLERMNFTDRREEHGHPPLSEMPPGKVRVVIYGSGKRQILKVIPFNEVGTHQWFDSVPVTRR